MKRRGRVYAYITGSRGLLILEQPQSPEAGLQVPGGTIEEGEAPSQAALREVEEETGLSSVELVSCLGSCEFDMRRYGVEELQSAWYFHLSCTQETPASWYFHEAHSVKEPIPFLLYWSALPYGGPELIGVHGHMLPSLHAALGLNA